MMESMVEIAEQKDKSSVGVCFTEKYNELNECVEIEAIITTVEVDIAGICCGDVQALSLIVEKFDLSLNDPDMANIVSLSYASERKNVSSFVPFVDYGRTYSINGSKVVMEWNERFIGALKDWKLQLSNPFSFDSHLLIYCDMDDRKRIGKLVLVFDLGGLDYNVTCLDIEVFSCFSLGHVFHYEMKGDVTGITQMVTSDFLMLSLYSVDYTCTCLVNDTKNSTKRVRRQMTRKSSETLKCKSCSWFISDDKHHCKSVVIGIAKVPCGASRAGLRLGNETEPIPSSFARLMMQLNKAPQASLSGVEPLMQKIHSEIRRVDAEILTAVRQQSNSGTKAREDLAAATSAVQELMNKIREIKTKAEQSETMVQEICRDIKKLDFAKKHITTTITALHRLTMLVSAVEQLQVMASKRHYKEAAAQLEAVNQLCSHFEAYRDIPKITELREKFKSIKQVLKSHVFSDFSRYLFSICMGELLLVP
ncbi:Vacuolar protein sorting-associated protein 53 A [Capsicum chinense]|nr:Vacuolar protein sorting-associated protein 53 A [Capsicum chinense]